MCSSYGLISKRATWRPLPEEPQGNLQNDHDITFGAQEYWQKSQFVIRFNTCQIMNNSFQHQIMGEVPITI